MKKLLTAVAFTALSATGFAQEQGTFDAQLTVGGLTTNDFRDVVENSIISGLIEGATYDDESSRASYNFSGKYALEENWFVNLEGSLQKMDQDISKNKSKIGVVKSSFTTIGAGTEYHYVNKDWLQVYSGLSAAYTFQNAKYDYTDLTDTKKTENYFNFQVNAVGARLGKKVAGVIELGAGYQGVLKLGASYQF